MVAAVAESRRLRPSVLLLLGFVLANLLLFAAYRVAFLVFYVGQASAGEWATVLAYGARLDLALLGAECCAFGVFALIRGAVRTHGLFRLALVHTLLHALFTVADFSFYGQRNQHMGELLFANLSEPGVLGDELSSFVLGHPWMAAGGVAVLVLLVLLAGRLRRRLPAATWMLRGSWRRIAAVVLFSSLASLSVLEPVTQKRWRGGRRVGSWAIRPATSRHYARLGDYLLHQAIPNPLHEFVVVHVPWLFVDAPQARLSAEEALCACAELFPGVRTSARYPLLRYIESDVDLDLENVFVIQVEGLTRAVLDCRRGDRWVMPRLRALADEGLYFPRTVQSFANTSGGVFATAVSLPRSLNTQRVGVFLGEELSGYYASLPRILADAEYQHWWFSGFRQSHADYTAFLGNLGYRTMSYPAFHERLKSQAGAEGPLGINDGPFLRACAELVSQSPKCFSAHAMTSNTHAPWTVPASSEAPFSEDALTAFRYVDESIHECLEVLRGDMERFRRTLFVIVADHTSVTFQRGRLERLEIPLIFYSPRLSERFQIGARSTRASHADIQPTVLSLLGGRHRYAGLGRDLTTEPVRPGVISATRNEVYYFKGDYVLVWVLGDDEFQLWTVSEAGIDEQDVADEHLERFLGMQRELFAQCEAAQRLAQQRAVFPIDRLRSKGD